MKTVYLFFSLLCLFFCLESFAIHNYGAVVEASDLDHFGVRSVSNKTRTKKYRELIENMMDLSIRDASIELKYDPYNSLRLAFMEQ